MNKTKRLVYGSALALSAILGETGKYQCNNDDTPSYEGQEINDISKRFYRVAITNGACGLVFCLLGADARIGRKKKK